MVAIYSDRRSTIAMNLLRLLCVVGTCLFAASAAGVETRDPYHYFFTDSFGEFNEDLASAREKGKKGVLIFFEMDECPFCRWMKENVLNRSDVQDYYNEQFICYTVDIEGDLPITDFQGVVTTQKEFAQVTHRVRATPVFAFFDLEGNRVLRFTGKTRD